MYSPLACMYAPTVESQKYMYVHTYTGVLEMRHFPTLARYSGTSINNTRHKTICWNTKVAGLSCDYQYISIWCLTTDNCQIKENVGLLRCGIA